LLVCLLLAPLPAWAPTPTGRPGAAARARPSPARTRWPPRPAWRSWRKGGNAFDAAVAVSAVLSVVEPISSGLGGGGFFLLHDAKTGKDVFVDARETAPAAATPERYLDKAGNWTATARERPVVGRHPRPAGGAGARGARMVACR
jgi:gamma-glutamyltranspeptidase/glutathione hydrolase